MVLMRPVDQNKQYTPFRLKSLDNMLIGCRLTNNSINIIYDRKTTQFTEKQIRDAIDVELMPNIKEILDEINSKVNKKEK